MARYSFGAYFDDPDTLYSWMNTALFSMISANAMNRSGATARLLEGPASASELAAACRLPEGKLRRLLDYMVANEVVAVDADGNYCATPRCAIMLDASGSTQAGFVSVMAGSKLVEGMREDSIPFELFFGKPVFELFAEEPEMRASFGHFMGFMTRRFERFLKAHHRFQPFSTVADIGGSMGDLLLGVLQDNPGTSGILFDLPDTVETARPLIARSPLASRVELVGGSFFEQVPTADLYVMKQILHDWDDEECRQILATIRRAIPPTGRLASMEHILSDVPAPDEAQSTDIAMMVWDTGRERKLGEFEALFAATGFAIDRISRNPEGHSVIEVVPV